VIEGSPRRVQRHRYSAVTALLGSVAAAVAVAGCTGRAATPVSAPTTKAASSPSFYPGNGCAASPVHVAPLPTGLDPVGGSLMTWIGTNDFAAVLFYSRDGSPIMTAGGKMPDGSNTKILWLVRDPVEGQLTIRGSTPAGGKTFVQRVEGGGNYPSIVVVPNAGCWTLEASLAGRKVGEITVPVRDP